jgi:tRNA threonylcarbamoyladenosine biosynthesis protein TsaB
VRVLGIETSGNTGGFAVIEDGRLLAEVTSEVTGHHLEKSAVMIEGVLTAAGTSAGGLGAIAVSLGPGSFTGLRVGLALAKGICFGTGLPLVGVPTLDCIAEGLSVREGLIVPVRDARRGEVYFSVYESRRGRVSRLSEYAAMTPDRVADRVLAEGGGSADGGAVLLAGDALARYGSALARKLGARAQLAPEVFWPPRPGIVAALGLELLSRGGVACLDTVEPLYVRPSEAERKLAGSAGHGGTGNKENEGRRP